MPRSLNDKAPVTRAELRALLTAALAVLDDAPGVYSSRKGHGPPGYEHRAWQCIAGAIGVRRGRWYIVTQAQLAAYEVGQEVRSAAPRLTPPTSSSAALAAKLGLRLVAARGAR